MGRERRWPPPFRRWSLTAQLITSYLVILGIGGLVTSVIGSWITSSAFMAQAQPGVEALAAAARNRVILSFFILATIGFVAIITTTYVTTRRITRPLEDMAEATRGIAAGRFDQEIRAELPGELGLLAGSFNIMTHSLRQMRGDLEEWGRTLEEKVAQRTEELMEMQARVAQSERLASLGMLAAGVAHEINNPLGGILVLTSLTLEDTPADDARRENLAEVVRQTERCRDIVKGLLEFSRQSKAGTERVDVNAVLLGTLTLMGSQALLHNIEIVRDAEPDLPAVLADASQLQQVFMNLIVNAAQAMDERGTLSIRTRYHTADGHVEIRVSDTGKGIPPEQIGHIFDPFFTTKTSGAGTGLGLSIVFGIVTKYGGTIAVESEPGRGTTFTIRFPAARGPERPVAPDAAQPGQPAGTAPAAPASSRS